MGFGPLPEVADRRDQAWERHVEVVREAYLQGNSLVVDIDIHEVWEDHQDVAGEAGA